MGFCSRSYHIHEYTQELKKSEVNTGEGKIRSIGVYAYSNFTFVSLYLLMSC